MGDLAIEQECTEKGLTSPRIMMADIEANIASEHYACGNVAFAAQTSDSERALSCLTFCVLVLRNGFTVTGESACASTDNFDEEIGRKIARQNAIQKVWPLMGYALKSSLVK